MIDYKYLVPQVNSKLRLLAKSNVENTETLNNLADQTEEFAVQLIDQVNGGEQLAMRDVPEKADRCASMLSGMTDKAIEFSQKKVRILLKKSNNNKKRRYHWLLVICHISWGCRIESFSIRS